MSKDLTKFNTRIDPVLLISVCTLLMFSVLSLYSYNSNAFFNRQIIWATISIIIFVIVSRIDLRFMYNTKIIIYFYLFSNLLLLYSVFFGEVINGAKAWIDFGLFSFQPADLAKLATLFVLAKYFSKRHVEIQFLRHIVVSLIYALIPVSIIMMQPDLGSAVVIMFMWFFVVFMSGLSKKHLFAMLILAASISVLMWNFGLAKYQKDRILNFVNPTRDLRGSGYNVYQAFIAIGSGGLTGKGVGMGTQSKLEFLPEHETDFIFSSYAEEWGYLGVILLLTLFFIILARLLYIAYYTDDAFVALLTLGVFAWIFIHVYINISMNLGLFPVTGIPLPFMSYGGSHVILLSLALGIVASFRTRNQKSKIKSDFFVY